MDPSRRVGQNLELGVNAYASLAHLSIIHLAHDKPLEPNDKSINDVCNFFANLPLPLPKCKPLLMIRDLDS